MSAVVIATPLSGQSITTIRGVVTDSAGHGIEGAIVIVANHTRTVIDSAAARLDGTFIVAMPAGTDQDSLIVVTRRFGFHPSIISLARNGSQEIAPLRVVLQRVPATLATVSVHGKRAPPTPTNPLDRQPGASQLVGFGFEGEQLGERGNLASLTANLPGAIEHDGGVTYLGLPTATSATTIDGAPTYVGSLPRDARISSRISGTTFDVSRGGFAGASTDVAPGSGTNTSTYMLRLFGEPAFLQPQTSSPTSARASEIGMGGVVTGPIAVDRAFYSVALQNNHRNTRIAPLDAFQYSGQSWIGLQPDTLGVFTSGLTARGLPPISRPPFRQVSNELLGTGRVDVTTGTQSQLWLIGDVQRDALTPAETSPAALASQDIRARHWASSWLAGASTIRHAIRFESLLSFSNARSTSGPLLNAPAITVRAGTISSGQTSLSGGGASTMTGSSWINTVFAKQSASWASRDRRHATTAFIEARSDAGRSLYHANPLGAYNYSSLATLLADDPDTYELFGAPPGNSGRVKSLGAGLSDEWRARPRLRIQGGARMDVISPNASGGGTESPLLTADHRTSVNVSPRLGLTWVVGGTPGGSRLNGVVTAGIGRFVGTVSPVQAQLLSASAVSHLACTNLAGSADNEAAMGGTECPMGLQRVETVPGVRLASDLAPPSTWRGNVGLSTVVPGQNHISLQEIISSTSRLPDLTNRNLGSASSAFQADGRITFTAPDQISPAGYVPFNGARSSDFGPIWQTSSDARSFSATTALEIKHDFEAGRYISASYVHTDARDRTRGFASGGSSGDPDRIEWHPSDLARTHVFTVDANLEVRDGVFVSGAARFLSGMRYTPIVASDINGDGAVNDRAFVPAFATAPDSLGAALREFVASGDSHAARCITLAASHVASPNSCETPWSGRIDLSLSLTPRVLHLGPRTYINVDLYNVSALADRLLHGVRLHGWGQSSAPDPRLFFPTAWDVASRKFAYSLNRAFGTQNSGLTTSPFSVRIGVTVNLEPDRDEQGLALDEARGRRGSIQLPSATELLARYTHRFPDPAQVVLRTRNDILLTDLQAVELASLSHEYALATDSTWAPYVARLVEAFGSGRATSTVADLHRTSRTAATLFQQFARRVRSVLTAAQYSRLPAPVALQSSPGWVALLDLDP